ncbi:MAG TPA: tryptophan 7-halogenase, partial [Silvibacterium sp.]|nr:tryptophan 7-halogenase [Silvibacterium sp.]
LNPAKILDISQRDGRWIVDVRPSGKQLRVEANLLVDATGRVNLLGGKRVRISAPMLALWSYWTNAKIAGAATRVESGAQEWFWGAPLPDGSFNATVFMDPRRYHEGIAQTGTLSAFYESLIAGSELLRCCMSGTRAGAVSICDASCYISEEMATATTIKIGEAAFTIDPLSSQGVQTAIGTALHAAAVIHTISRRPENTRLALDFYNSRQRDAANLHSASASTFYAQAAEYYGTDFWLRRATGPHGQIFKSSHAQPLAPFPDPDTLIQISRDTRITNVPCLKDDFIVPARGVTHPNLDHPLVFLENVAVAPLLEQLPGSLGVRELMQRLVPIIGPDSARRVFIYFWNTEVLCAASAPSRSQDSFADGRNLLGASCIPLRASHT